MSFEPHYVNTHIIFATLFIISCMVFSSMLVLFMDSLDKDDTIINEFYYKPSRRRSRRRMKKSKSF